MMGVHLLSAALALLFVAVVTAYRPVQFVKHTGQNGRADQAFSLVNYYNETTQQSDLWVRMQAFRYQSLATGWASLALGPQMKGALMFITYGDPSNAGQAMTLTVRTASGHSPPRPLDEMTGFYPGYVPDVDVFSARFEPYTGEYYHETLQKPSHLGVAEFVIRGFDKWTAPVIPVANDTIRQEFIWSSNFKQDYGGDFSPERAIDMHQFGLGFGFLWVDLKNALSPLPFFGPIRDMEGHKGVNEIGDPPEPTAEELQDGEAIIAEQRALLGGASPAKADDEVPPPPPPVATAPEAPVDPAPVPATHGADDGTTVEEPVKTVKQWNIRSFMWHLHGLLMTVAFLVAYPLGIYLLRSGRPTAFNLHWTVNSLGSMCAGVSALIGFVNSHSISITHQYLGILLICGLAVQTVLGWRHHVIYISHSPAAGRRTWMSQVHVWLGRVVLPVGMLNVVLGLLLRDYGWLVISLTIALAAVELIVLTLMVGRARNRRGPAANSKNPSIPLDDGAEEYFQLAGDDDDDEFSDDEPEGAASSAEERARKREAQEEQAKRLARLDKV